VNKPRFARKVVAAAALLAASSAMAQTSTADMIKARQKIFGIENVNATTGALKKDQVIFSWLGHNTGAVSMYGRIFMIDSYIARLEVTPGRTPFVIKDVVDIKPEAIFVGHGHGDHADNAAFIAAKAGTKLYMSTEACGTAQTALTRMKNDPFMQADAWFAIPQSTTIECTGMTTAGSVPATEVARVRQFDPLVCVLAYRALHSTSVPTDPVWGFRPVIDQPDPNDAKWFPPGVRLTPNNPRMLGQQDIRQGAGPGGVDQINYMFIARTGYNFTIQANVSIGALKEGIGSNYQGTPADGQRLMDLAGKVLPNTDYLFTTLDSGNVDNNGWRDLVMWTEAIRPKILTGGHVPVGAAMQYYSGFLDQLAFMEQPRTGWPGFPRSEWPQIRNHTDPTDILKPQVFNPGDPAWFNPQKAPKIAQYCS